MCRAISRENVNVSLSNIVVVGAMENQEWVMCMFDRLPHLLPVDFTLQPY